MELTGQRVVLLGGTSGIGFATAKAVAAQGGLPVVVSSRQSSVDRAIAALPDGAEGHAVDLRDAAGTAQLLTSLGRFDHLVYTAGEPLELMPLDTLDTGAARDFFGLRYFGALAAVHAAAPLLRPGGSIVLTSGTAKDRPGPGWAVAAGICGAVEATTRALAVELAPLRVNAVSPGVSRSPLWERLDAGERERMYAEVAEGVLLKRVGELEDVARGYLYCLTQPYTTGITLTVDGGGLLL